MSHSLANRTQVTLGQRLTRVDLKPAKAALPATIATESLTLRAFACIERTQGHHQKSDKEMGDLLGGISQSVYARRSYNAARAWNLPTEMRQTFIRFSAEDEGLQVQIQTPQEKLKAATREAIIQLLTLMEAL